MNVPTVLRIAASVIASVIMISSASVAGAQLSARSANGGLFNSMVDWNPVAENALVGVGDVRMSPWATNRVQLGRVTPADPNRPWMGYWGHSQDRELANIIGAEHSLRANPIALQNAANRREQLPLAPPRPQGGPTNAAASVSTDDQEATQGSQLTFFPAGSAVTPPLAPAVAANVIINPEPSVYWLAAVGLVLIALIRRFRMA